MDQSITPAFSPLIWNRITGAYDLHGDDDDLVSRLEQGLRQRCRSLIDGRLDAPPFDRSRSWLDLERLILRNGPDRRALVVTNFPVQWSDRPGATGANYEPTKERLAHLPTNYPLLSLIVLTGAVARVTDTDICALGSFGQVRKVLRWHEAGEPGDQKSLVAWAARALVQPVMEFLEDDGV